MKKYISIALLIVVFSSLLSVSAFAAAGRDGGRSTYKASDYKWAAGTDNPGGVNSRKDSTQAPATSSSRSKRAVTSELEPLYDEFQKFWYVRDSYDLQDRFEEFLKSKHVDPKDIDGYDDFMETWVDHYDEDLEFDELYDVYDLGSDDIDDPDEYDILLDDDVDDLYDDYLDDYIDEEYYEDYGEYFDEVYYD